MPVTRPNEATRALLGVVETLLDINQLETIQARRALWRRVLELRAAM